MSSESSIDCAPGLHHPALPCRSCGTIDTPTIGPGKGPHALRAHCRHCGSFAQWLRGLAKIICPFLFSMCYDRLYAEPNKRDHCSKVYHFEAALG